MNELRHILTISLFMAATVTLADESSGAKSIAEMSLEELMQVKVFGPAALTRLTSTETPASITVISAEEIAYTPARNIFDLLETYVPGAVWMNHSAGPVLAIRGSMANRNYKFLLRVNGRVMNNKAHYGIKTELEQWDLSDISRIEIVRGPGSVIYGPGAVAGVINIITHDAKSAEGLRVAAGFLSEYDSKGASVSYGYQGDNYDIFAFASATWTQGTEARHFLGSNDDMPGFVGEDIQTSTQPLDYFGDYNDDPRLKLHIDTAFLDHWRFWARYTQQGSFWASNETKSDFDGVLLNQAGVRDRHWTVTLDYDNDLRSDLSVSAMLSADSSDVERRKDNVRDPDPNSILNKKTDFSETEIFFRGLVNWQVVDSVEVALGVEYSWDHYGPGWGDDEKDMRLGDDGVIVSGPDSNAISPGNGGSADKDGNALFVGDGWSTSTYSIFSEVNLSLKPWLSTLFSARLDKSSFSDWLLSPRFAVIAEVAQDHYLKLIVQQAQRMNTSGQMYTLYRNGIASDPETLTALELIYSTNPSEDFSLNIAAFWNDLEVISWNSDENMTSRLGDLRLYGIEPELRYAWSFGQIGASYSFVKQIDWQLAPDVLASNVSYSEYSQPLEDSAAIQTGVGNDLNNWPNQSIKLYVTFDLTERLILHIDSQIYWDFQGLRDGLIGLRSAVADQPEESAVLAAIQITKDEGVYDREIKLNASLSYELTADSAIRVFAQNILGSTTKRYAFDTGANKASPHRVRFFEEPRTIGVRLDYKF